jgi:hypothetical protein
MDGAGEKEYLPPCSAATVVTILAGAWEEIFVG